MRSVIHWDGDSFFASIEQASDKRLRDRPVAIGGARRGVVLSASNEARRFQIRPGMPMSRARRLCAPLVVIPGHFDLYEQFSHQILSLCEDTTPLVEPTAVGAAYLDVTGMDALLRRDPTATAAHLRRTIWQWLRISISTGLGGNKTVARIASRLRKPAAQMAVPRGGEAVFLSPLPLRWLPGVGDELRATLEIAGVRTIGQLAHAPLDALQLAVGRNALALQRRAQGVDEDPVRPKPAADPTWREFVEFEEDVWDEPQLLATLRKLLERLMTRVRAAGIEIRRLTLSLRYTDRDESERSLMLAEPTALELDIEPSLPGLLRGAWTRRVRLRAMTLRASRLYQPSPQLTLFGPPAARRPEALALACAIDRLRKVYGEGIVNRGASIPLR
jgi:nucleotidyltransferase/DNA polymerase involved in DNA repair